MRIALVCGDGLPVSGLLTVFRNVVHLFGDSVDFSQGVPADLGYSWRPDKPAFYPAGPEAGGYPEWLRVSREMPVSGPGLDDELVDIRQRVAVAETLSPEERADLWQQIERLAAPYEKYFHDWFEQHGVDWVCAVNMTLSDAVPVTLALHRAAERRWSGGRPGGVLFWDHDLYGSYAVHETRARVYPSVPNEFTPVPQDQDWHLWAVVSEQLAAEAETYPTRARALTVPNVLPRTPAEGLEPYHEEFLEQIGAVPGQPILLAPVRVFRVKGLELSVQLFAGVRRACEREGRLPPLLLVFGDLGEDPEYSETVVARAREEGVLDHVGFLGGVPLESRRDPGAGWCLDEVDLLRLCAHTGGGVLFTPNRPDVESVGLGPALATVAGLPSAVTDFNAFAEIYGDSFYCVRFDPASGAERAGEELLRAFRAREEGEPWFDRAVRRNKEIVDARFPTEPWRRLLAEMDRRLGEGQRQ